MQRKNANNTKTRAGLDPPHPTPRRKTVRSRTEGIHVGPAVAAASDPADRIPIQEEERRRLARELHDDFSQRLAAALMELDAACGKAPLTIRSSLREVHDRLARLADDVRHLARRLHASTLDDLGLIPALESECESFTRLTGMPVTLIAGGSGRVPGPIELCLYRVVQESLSNIRKHARPGKVRIELRRNGKEARMSVEDSGDGFDTTVRQAGGLGLTSMEERVRLVRGRLSVTSQPGKTTRVEVRVRFPPSGNDPVFHRVAGELGRRAEFQLPSDARPVKLHGFHRHLKNRSDLLRRMTFGDQLKHFNLA